MTTVNPSVAAPASPPEPGTRVSTGALKVACSRCNLRELCLPVGLSAPALEELDGLVATRRVLRRGEMLFRRGEPFQAVFAVRTGFFKTCTASEDGRDQVTGFQMAGELLGFDGIGEGTHHIDAIALEDSQVCVIPYAQLEQLAHELPALQRQLHRVMSREIVRDHGVMLLLSSMRAEERVAAFLLNLAKRLEARGFSPSSLILRMTRAEIGAYLGLKLETVSRCFSRFHEDGVLEVNQREVRIVDAGALQLLVSGNEP